MRKIFSAKICRYEWLTIQCKCLSDGEVTHSHLDKTNCTWKSYTSTGALCFVICDESTKKVWSIKFILNSKSSIGQYFAHQLPNQQLANQFQTYLDGLNQVYREYPGTPMNLRPLSWRNFDDTFSLNDNCPWDVSMEPNIMKLQTGTNSYCWLSAPAHQLRKLRQVRELDLDPMLEMILLSSYQSCWTQHWHVIEEMCNKDDLDLVDHPVNVYCRLSKKKPFLDLNNGQYNRYSLEPTKLPFELMFGGFYKVGVLDPICGIMTNVVSWIEDTVDFTEMLDEEYSRVCLDFCTEMNNLTKCEMGEFRFQILINLLVLTGMVNAGHNVVNRRYPIPRHPSYQHLVEVLTEEFPVEFTTKLHFLGNKFGVQSQAVVDNICSGSWSQAESSFDVFYRGQSLYRVGNIPHLDGGYGVLEKTYGETKWALAK